MRTKDFIYYASVAVLMAVTTQVASADEVATQMPTVTEGNQYQPATAAEIFGGGVVLAQESPSARPSSTVAETPTATSEVANSSAPQVSQASSTKIAASESRVVASESVVQANTVASSENATVPTASEVSSNTVAEPAKLTHSHDTDVLKPKASFSIENNNKVTGTFDAVVRDIVAPLGVKEVLVPSWSLANGQDDLIWHKAAKQMDGSYRVTIKAVDHKGEAGNYRADAYVVDRTNKRHYISEKVVSVNYARPSASLTIENNNAATGTFDAVVKNIIASTGVKEILVPSWSLVGGQDDLIWHKATKQADGSYRATIKASDHKNSTGKYRADAYIVDNFNKRFYLTEKVVEVSQSRPSASLTIENNDATTGTFDAVVRNIVAPYGLKEILVPSWSLVNGQDDLVWHKASKQADGSYRVTIKASDHKHSTGKYRADVYLVDKDDNRQYLTETVVDVNETKPSGSISILNNNGAGSFDVVISDVYSPKGVRTVQVPVWSEADGQDDIRWYEATRQTDGNYKVTVQVANHKNVTGLYNVHLYYIQNDGSRIGVGGTQTKVTLSDPKADLAITGLNNATGSYDLVISKLVAPRGFKEVLVPTWSEKNGQDDIIWYNATRLNNGNYKVNVSLTDHKNERGLYNVHLYYVETNGKLVGVGGTTYTVPAKVEETHTTTSYSLPDVGTYTFKERSSIKAEPRVASPELAYYDAGMSVNYDKIVSGDGYQWLSYLSYNGNRRYVAVAKLAQQESKPSGTINIENLSNLGFDVHITNVSGGDKAIQGVSVPVWTSKDGQDDLVWHQADRQSDGSYKVRINVSDHKAEAGEYIVHLYYVQDGKMVGIGGTSTTVPVQNATRHNLPASGSYTFTARTGIKTQPLVANPDVSYYDSGMSVNYDKVVNNDGYTWLSYLSYSGHRFYVAIASTSVTKPVEQPVQPSTPSSGTYTFKERSSIKAEPSVASPELAYYDAGMSVNYDRLVTADGHTWLSYVSHGGNRRYIAIDGKATAVAQPASPSLAATGTYTFTKPSSIKAQPSVASPELAYYDKGMSVRYDKVLTADGHTWLSYVTYSGARRYVDIS